MKYINISEKYRPDLYWVHGVYDAMVGPNIQDKYIYPFIKEIRRNTDIPLIRFVSGKISNLLEKEVETGVEVIEVLEPYPTGDVDLSDAKKRIGKEVCLKGDIGYYRWKVFRRDKQRIGGVEKVPVDESAGLQRQQIEIQEDSALIQVKVTAQPIIYKRRVFLIITKGNICQEVKEVKVVLNRCT